MSFNKKNRPKPPAPAATSEQLKALQELFAGIPSEQIPDQQQIEREHRQALNSLFTGIGHKPLGIKKSEEAWQKAKVIQKRQRAFDPLEIEAAEQEKLVQARKQQREARRVAALNTPEKARQRRSMANALQYELSRIARGVSQGILAALLVP